MNVARESEVDHFAYSDSAAPVTVKFNTEAALPNDVIDENLETSVLQTDRSLAN